MSKLLLTTFGKMVIGWLVCTNAKDTGFPVWFVFVSVYLEPIAWTIFGVLGYSIVLIHRSFASTKLFSLISAHMKNLSFFSFRFSS